MKLSFVSSDIVSIDRSYLTLLVNPHTRIEIEVDNFQSGEQVALVVMKSEADNKVLNDFHVTWNPDNDGDSDRNHEMMDLIIKQVGRGRIAGAQETLLRHWLHDHGLFG